MLPLQDRSIVPERGQVRVAVYDITGRLVKKLVDGVYEAGRHSVVWDGRDADGGAVASGIYIYELRTGAIVQTGRMVLAR